MAPVAVSPIRGQVADPAVTSGSSNTSGGGAAMDSKSIVAQENLCAVLHGARDVRMEVRPHQEPEPGEVQIRIVSTGLCGSDSHYYLHGRNGDFALCHPMCLGHESSGVVVALGSGLPDICSLKVGDRVAVEAGRYCKECEWCLSGRYNLCCKMRFASSAKTTPHLDGTLRRYMNWPWWLCHPLPENVSFRSAALVEPLSVVLQAFRRTRFELGERVLVFGAGAVGLLACAAAKAAGASTVAAVDIDQGRLTFAKENGWADATYLIRPQSISKTTTNGIPEEESPIQARARQDRETIGANKAAAEDLLNSLRGVIGGTVAAGFDLVLECTGVSSCVQMGIFAARPGGRVGLIGMGQPIQTLPVGAASLREVDLVGVFRYAGIYPVALRMLSGGALRQRGLPASGSEASYPGGIENLISHVYTLEDARTAFETIVRGKGEDGSGVVKVFIEDPIIMTARTA